jgi:hypothetical protein
MRKLILFALLLITAHLVAQTLPPQFSGLLTNSTDYTTSGSWTTPTIPSPGSSYTDSIFGIQANRIPSPTSCPTNSNYNPSGLCSITTTKLNVDYAKTVPWSVDDTYYVATDISGLTGTGPTMLHPLLTRSTTQDRASAIPTASS